MISRCQYLGGRQKGVSHRHRAVHPAMLEVLGEQLRDAVDFGIGPKVGIEPGQAIGGRAANSVARHGVINQGRGWETEP